MPAPVWMHERSSQMSVKSLIETIRQKKRPEHDMLCVAPPIARKIKKVLRSPFFWGEAIDCVDGLDIVAINGIPGAIIAQRGDLFPTVADHKADTASTVSPPFDETETLK